MATYTSQCSAVGSFKYASNFTLYVTLNEIDVDIENNSSKIEYNVYCQSNGSGSISASHYKYFYLNGVNIIDTTESVNVSSPNAYIHIASGTTDVIWHENDGSRSVWFSAQISANSYGVSAEVSGTFTLTTIPRASSIGATSAYIEESTIINISRASSSFKHTILYSFYDLDGTVIEKTSDTTINWQLPESFYEQIPNQKSSWATLTCITYSYNSENKSYTEIGRKTCTFTVNTNEQKCKPTLEATLVDKNNETVTLTGDNSKLIKYHSNAEITITCTTKNSAEISTKEVNGISFTGDSVTLEKIETNTFVVTVTDSRGYSTSVTLNPEMVNYIPLTINATIKRTQPTTGEVEISFSGNYFNGNFGSKSNTLGIDLFYRESGSEDPWTLYGAIIPTIDSENNTYSNENSFISLGDTFDYQKSYEFYLDVIDELTELQPTYTVTQGIPIFNWGKDFVNVYGKLLLKEVNLLELIFPIGSLYITQENINPSTILGFGTWERFKGKVCVGLDENDIAFNAIRKTGGEKTHTLTIEEMPSHKPSINTWKNNNDVTWGTGVRDDLGFSNIANSGDGSLQTSNDFLGFNAVGGNQAHNNLQPYEVVGYMWIRRS